MLSVRRVEVRYIRDSLALGDYERADVMRTLPPELVGIIVDHLHDDLYSLRACSLVSKAWTPAARFHLFRALAIRRVKTDDRITTFANFLSTTWGQSNAAYVRRLCLRGPSVATAPMHNPDLDLETLGAIVHKLPNLESLELWVLAWPGLKREGPAPLTSTSVRSLTITQISMYAFTDVGTILDVLHLFPNLRKFKTNYVLWRDGARFEYPDINRHRPLPHKLQLEDITLRANGLTSRFVTLLHHMIDFDYLTSLSVWHLDIHDIPTLGQFLLHVGPRLRYFHIKLNETRFVDDDLHPAPADMWPLLNLRECTNLETFNLFIPMDEEDSSQGPVPFVPNWESATILFGLLPNSVRTLHLGFEVLGNEDELDEQLNDVQWELVDQHLSQLPHLERIEAFWEDRHEEYIYCKLPSFVRYYLLDNLQSFPKKMFHFKPSPSHKLVPPSKCFMNILVG